MSAIPQYTPVVYSFFEERGRSSFSGGAPDLGYAPRFLSMVLAFADSRFEGRQIYARRLAIVEPVFANLRVQKRLDHFTVRSKAKVDVQWKLFALVHNIGKIQQYGRVR